MASLTANGIELNTLAYGIQNRGGRWRMPGKRGENIPMPGVHGALSVKGKVYAENTLALSMWAVGANTDGTIPTDKDMAKRCLTNLDTLSEIFSMPVIDLRQTQPDGSVRQCNAEVIQAIDFSSMSGGTRAEFAVELLVSDPFWRDLTATSQTLLTGVGTSRPLRFTSFAAATAPLTGLTITVTGPVASPVLTDPVTGQWVKLGQTLLSGQTWVLNNNTWTSVANAANAISKTTHGGGATWLDLTASDLGPALTLTNSGSTTTATSVNISGKRSYFLA